jgi:6-pyruvoyltetrahydropterin/6-carboxytetrahydropterin synthase
MQFKSAFTSTKTYGHEEGLSCAFRQWRANESHCHLVHGYALSFKFTFAQTHLDARGWVMDFGGLKELKHRLKETFDHVLAVAEDDPELQMFLDLDKKDIAQVKVFPDGVGVERFAKCAFDIAHQVLAEQGYTGLNPRVWVESCECAEHGANSAIFSKVTV